MPVKTHKRSKFSKWRGNWSHGWGAKKKHRGSGHRAGAGMGGRGKRGAAKGTLLQRKREYFGKFGFKKKNVIPMVSISLQYFEDRAESLVAAGKISQKNGVYEIDLKALGYDKLLSKGKVQKKFRIIAAVASPGAIEKVKSAGGEVQLTKKVKVAKEE